MANKNTSPEPSEATRKLPEVTRSDIPVDTKPAQEVPLPAVGNPENTIRIGDKLVEIRSTKVRYQRDRTAGFYRAMELYPLADILASDAGVFDKDRNGDKCVMDWLIAVTDDPELIINNYNDMDTDVIERLLVIFRRVNNIDAKEQNVKNALAKQKEVTMG